MKTVVSLVAFYVVTQILADIGSLRIVAILGLSMDAGTLLYPLTFTIRDMIHRYSDKSIAYLAIILGVIANVVMFLFFYLVSVLPPDLSVGEQTAFGQTLTPVFRIVIASIIAEFISELLDTHIFSKLHNKGYLLQIVGSNVPATILDSAIFSAIAFYGIVPAGTLVSIFVANVLIKLALTAMSAPIAISLDKFRNRRIMKNA